MIITNLDLMKLGVIISVGATIIAGFIIRYKVAASNQNGDKKQ